MAADWNCGRHFIVDMWGVDKTILTDKRRLESICVAAAENAQATVLHTFFHHFGGDYGVTGVVALAESHISIHTWPEKGFAALDIYMCGDCSPSVALYYIVEHIKSEYTTCKQLFRGLDNGK